MAKRKEDKRVEEVIENIQNQMQNLYVGSDAEQSLPYMQLQLSLELLLELRQHRLGKK